MNRTMEWRLVRELTLAQLKARYRRTWAGFLWVMLSPIVLYSAQAIVFKKILRIQRPDYAMFLLGGLLPWIFIVQSLEMGIPVLQSSRELLMAFRIRPFYLVLCTLLDNTVNFLASFLIILIPVLFWQGRDLRGLAFLPLALMPLFLGVCALTWFLSVFNIFYRDVKFIVHFLIGVLFFLTPVFYPIEFIPAEMRWLAYLNPIYGLIEPVRACIYLFSFGGFAAALGRAWVSCILFLTISYFYWKRRSNEFYYHL